MSRYRRQVLIYISGFFGAGLVHSLLPPGDIYFRATVTAIAAIVISGLLALLLPLPPMA